MLKFVDLTAALDENQKVFAFYNKETGHFLSFFNRQIWHSQRDFINCLEEEKDKDSDLEIENYIVLIPPDFQ